MLYRRHGAKLIIFLCVFQSASWAQTATSTITSGFPDPTIELRRQQEREAQDRKRLETTTETRPAADVPKELERLPIGETPCLKIDQINIEGDGLGYWTVCTALKAMTALLDVV